MGYDSLFLQETIMHSAGHNVFALASPAAGDRDLGRRHRACVMVIRGLEFVSPLSSI